MLNPGRWLQLYLSVRPRVGRPEVPAATNTDSRFPILLLFASALAGLASALKLFGLGRYLIATA